MAVKASLVLGPKLRLDCDPWDLVDFGRLGRLSLASLESHLRFEPSEDSGPGIKDAHEEKMHAIRMGTVEAGAGCLNGWADDRWRIPRIAKSRLVQKRKLPVCKADVQHADINCTANQGDKHLPVQVRHGFTRCYSS